MAVAVICPRLNCRAVLRVPDDIRGKRVRCSSCGVSFFVPVPQKPSAGVSQGTGGSNAEKSK